MALKYIEHDLVIRWDDIKIFLNFLSSKRGDDYASCTYNNNDIMFVTSPIHLGISVCFLFNIDPAPRVIFKVEDPVRLQVCLAVDTPNVKYAHDIAVVRVEFQKMISWPYHEFILFHIEEQAPRCAKGIIIAKRCHSPRAISERGNEDSPTDEHELVVVDDNWLNPQFRDSTSDIQTHDTNLRPQLQDYHSMQIDLYKVTHRHFFPSDFIFFGNYCIIHPWKTLARPLHVYEP